tara:strand:- start:1539 stop:2789 length:1251 start_codon:yes stop_codon:yes gene_type:complete
VKLQKWPSRRLGDVVELVNGRGFKPTEWSRTGLPIIRIQNLNGNTEFNYFEGEYNPKIEVNHGDLLFAWSGSRGVSFGPHFWWGQKAVLNYHTWKVVPRDDSYDRHFLFAALKQLTAQIESKTHGFKTSFVHAQKCEVEEYKLPLPHLSEQKKIAAILSTWDRGIESTEKLIAAMQKRKQALMQQLLTGKVRFKEFVKAKSRQSTPLGDMPSDWKMFRFGKIVEKIKRKNTVGEEHVLTASGEFGLVDQREFFNRSVAGANLASYYLLKRGEFAYNRSSMKGYPFGAIKRLNLYPQGVLSTLYICFGITHESCDSNYLCHFFEARLLDKQLRGVTQVGGRAHGLLNITDSDFYSMKIVLPSFEEQQRIAAILDTQNIEIEHLRKKLDHLREQKKGLMQQLLTGKVRVNTDQETVKG